MSIFRAIDRAYSVAIERSWDKVYWCLDLHGTVLQSSYDSGEINFINEDIPQWLATLAAFPETVIILWSSITPDDEVKIRALFASAGIPVAAVNENPFIENTATGNFDKKFYFSILVDDKAGFCPTEWPDVLDRVAVARKRLFR